MQNWEYEQVWVKRGKGLEVATPLALNEYGAQGWELVSSFPERDSHGSVSGAWYTLRRPLGG